MKETIKIEEKNLAIVLAELVSKVTIMILTANGGATKKGQILKGLGH